MKPLHPERLEDGALRVNGKTREMLEKAPDQKLVWNEFVTWVNKFNRKRTPFGAPIAAGKNIRDVTGFDMDFVHVLNKLHCPKKEKTLLFNTRRVLDLDDIWFLWFENQQEPENQKMDTIRDYLEMSKDGAHDALQDCRDTGEVIMRFLNLTRELQRRVNKDGEKLIKFKGSFRKRAA